MQGAPSLFRDLLVNAITLLHHRFQVRLELGVHKVFKFSNFALHILDGQRC